MLTQKPRDANEFSASDVKITYTGRMPQSILLDTTPHAVFLPRGENTTAEQKPWYGVGLQEFFFTNQNIPNAADKLTSITFSGVDIVSREINFQYCDQLTLVSLPDARWINRLIIGDTANLTVLHVPVCEYIGELAAESTGFNNLDLRSVKEIGSLNDGTAIGTAPRFDELERVGTLGLNYSGALSFPKLKGSYGFTGHKMSSSGLGGNFTIGGGCTTLSAPVFEYCAGTLTIRYATCASVEMGALKTVRGTLELVGCTSLTTCAFPLLERAGGVSISSCPALTTFTLGAVIEITASVNANNNAALATFQLGTVGTTKLINGNINLSGCALTAAQVNAILALLVSLDGTNGTTLYKRAANSVRLNGGTNAAPTGQGITDKATLNSRTGGMVVTN